MAMGRRQRACLQLVALTVLLACCACACAFVPPPPRGLATPVIQVRSNTPTLPHSHWFEPHCRRRRPK